MSLEDVKRLVEYEASSGESVASWQVRGLWDANKKRVRSNQQAAELSALMRGLQDAYLRLLYRLLLAGESRLLVSLLNPDYAYFTHTFEDLDESKLTFARVESVEVKTPLRESLARRSVRIALEELKLYAEKGVADRKLGPSSMIRSMSWPMR